MFLFISNKLFSSYLSFLIIYKWVHTPGNSPLLIRTMIDMFLNFSDPMGFVYFYLFYLFIFFNLAPENILFPGQEFVQKILLVIAVISIPWMLLPKPIILIYLHYKEVKAKKVYIYYIS
jgi:V-type H+-transporting ATPase subunit a